MWEGALVPRYFLALTFLIARSPQPYGTLTIVTCSFIELQLDGLIGVRPSNDSIATVAVFIMTADS
jgi:hypothetical protein